MTKVLVVCNAYPSDENIYQNGFIHRRVKSYQKKGFTVEVYYLKQTAHEEEEYNYHDVNVTMGNGTHYSQYIQAHREDYASYLIHFINPLMYYPIIEYVTNPKLVIWIHGYEAEAWHRRWFNFLASVEELKAIVDKATGYYKEQLEFMNALYKEQDVDITFIHVSQWFKDHIADVDGKFAPQNYEIIPNIIDSRIFNFKQKQREGKLKILSIRPYASHKYANDQIRDAILLLSKKTFFKELEFHIYGEGKLYAELTAPLVPFDNVHLHNTFLRQREISSLHKAFDVFLCPTRLDSQGVSMCEAMSSGLAVVATDISAIPEFVEHNVSGLLAKPESPESIAVQIERLYNEAELLKNISYHAALSIRRKASEEVVINKELKVILGG
ncbi:glycosyltransferase family 4 protein [Macrococcus equipercicus]|uniref:Glycosyltransferase family 4 protein n=1 Tax=Macrococcus equipercicus TaxID=69967 RepID=A0A9Q9F3Q4_9STAP|nr:glycosyltransferase family 4 protein [Macrococcus equipercicus]UTH14489.1 glycosyltransferase family 4 protein [Macrococcus equipercicus]